MDKKSSFILFHDHLDSVLPELSMEQRGMLLTALSDHSHDRSYSPKFDAPELSGLRIAYSIMSGALDTNAEKYEQRCRINAANRAKAHKASNDQYGSISPYDKEKEPVTIVNDRHSSRCDTGTDIGTETDTVTGTGTGVVPAPPTAAIYKNYGLYHNVRLTDREHADIMARVINPEERINKYSTGIYKEWKGYDTEGYDHYERIILFADKDGMLRSEPLKPHTPAPPLTINEEDRKHVLDYVSKAFGDKGLVREGMEMCKIYADDSKPSSPGVVEKLKRYADCQNQSV